MALNPTIFSKAQKRLDQLFQVTIYLALIPFEPKDTYKY